jgi:hypothetical protein
MSGKHTVTHDEKQCLGHEFRLYYAGPRFGEQARLPYAPECMSRLGVADDHSARGE